MFIEKGTREGVSCIAITYSKANNEYMKNYNKKVDPKYIVYLDANNLYGWVMCKPLPIGGHRWLSDDEIRQLIKNGMPDEGNKGWVLEVDLEYPDELHDLHDNLPLAPSRRVVKDNELSENCEKIGEKLHVSSDKVEKLVPDLHNKGKYVLHYANLKQCLELSLKLTKVHRVLEFRQEPWLKPCIEKNMKLRAGAKNAFEKDFFELMNNSVFGKTMENLRKRVDVHLVHSEEKLLGLVAKPTILAKS